MSDDHDVQHRNYFEAAGDAVSVREGESDGDGLFRIRMPVSSTAEARDGEAFTRERLEGFREQISDGDIGVFLDHGRSGVADSRYSALGKVGYWDSAEVASRDIGADLVADAVLMDPAGLDAEVGDVREALATLKAQAEVGVPLASSVGWSEDTGDREVPGGADLLEISIVGIPSDPRTTTASAEAAPLARAVSAATSDFDIATFVRELTTGGRKVVEVNGEEVDLTPPEAVQNAATVGLAKDDELEPDCGTGAGRTSARQIAGDDVTADRIDDIAAYLTSHEEDVTADGPPTDWSDEEWRDCGNLQYALWGGTGTGTGLEWAQSKANEVADANDEEVPYPDREARNLDDPAFAEGDAVTYRWQGERYHGRVGAPPQASVQPPRMPDPVTGADGEAVYPIHQWDADAEAYLAIEGEPNTAKPESALDTSTTDLPPLADADIINVDMPSTNNLDDPEFAEGDAVQWSSQDTPVHGRVAGVHEQFSPNEDVTITGDDGEAVYSIFEWDDSLSPPAFQNSPNDPNVAKPQSSLSESQKDMPPATEDNFSGNNMADSHDDDGEQTRMDMDSFMTDMLEMQEEQLRMMEEMMGGNEGGDEDDDEAAADAPEAEADADTDADAEDKERTVTLDGEERAVDEALAELRDQAADAEPADPATTDRAAEADADGEDSDTTDTISGFGLAARIED